MSNIIITLILAYTDCLRRIEAHRLNRAAHETNPAKVAYIHNRINAIVAERHALEAMVRVYLNRTAVQQKRKTA